MNDKRIVSSDLDTEFGRLLESQSTAKSAAEDALNVGMQRRAQGITSERVFDTFFSPFRQRTRIEVPTSRRVKNRWFYEYSKRPLVASAIEIHTEYPLSGFALTHEDPDVQDFFNYQKRQARLESFLPEAIKQYWIIGEFISFGYFDSTTDPRIWTDFTLLPPDDITIIAHSLARSKNKSVIVLKTKDEVLNRIVNNGPGHAETSRLYQLLPDDLIKAVKEGRDILLPDVQVSHFKRSASDLKQIRGESIIERILPLLMLWDKYFDAQYTIADRHVTPREFYFIGEPDNPADQKEISDFQNLLAQTWTNPNTAIIYHHAVRVQWEGANGRVLPLAQEYEVLTNLILAGLMMSKAFLHGEGPTYANASVALDVLISRYLQLRRKIEAWIGNYVYDPLCRIHKIYKNEQASLTHRFHVKEEKELDLPGCIWDKNSLKDDERKLNLLLMLAEKGILPFKDLYDNLNKDMRTVHRQIEKEKENLAEHKKKMQEYEIDAGLPGQAPKPPLGPGGPGGMVGAPGMPPMGGRPTTPDLPNLQAPTGEAVSPEGALPKGP